MAYEISLDGRPIAANKIELANIDRLQCLSVEFDVTSEEYHEVTTLLYGGEFDIKVPAEGIAFRGTIVEYSTSVTNLYEQGQVGVFKLKLMEVKE